MSWLQPKKATNSLMSWFDKLKPKMSEMAPPTLRKAIPLMNPRYRFYRHNTELVKVLDRFINAAINVSSFVPMMPEEMVLNLRRAIPLNLLTLRQLIDAGGQDWWDEHGDGEADPEADISSFIDALPEALAWEVRLRMPLDNVFLGTLWEIAGGPVFWREKGDGREPLINPKTGKVAWRLIVTMPPRHGKSETVSCLLAAYFVMRHPECWVALWCYGADLANKLSKIARGYFVKLGGRRDRSMFQIKQWSTAEGGGMWASGRNGSGTGKGWHLGISDDMLKDAKEATSQVIRSSLKDQYQGVFSTRAENPALEIIMATRWHPDDQIGWQLEEERTAMTEGEGEGFYVVHFPAEYEPHEEIRVTASPPFGSISEVVRLNGEPGTWQLVAIDETTFDVRDPHDKPMPQAKVGEPYASGLGFTIQPGRYFKNDKFVIELEALYPGNCAVHPDWRKPGEALWPEKYNCDRLKRILRRIGEYFYNALFRQRPSSRGGDTFNVSMIQIVDKAPPGLNSVRAWDEAYSLKKQAKNAFTCGGKLEGPDKDGYFYMVDLWRGQKPPDEVLKAQRQCAVLDGRRTKVRGPEDPAAGKRVAIKFVQNLLGFNVVTRPVSGSGDKGFRCAPLAAQVNIGMVRMVKGTWNKTALDEMEAAPNGTHWDIIDVFSDAFDELVNHMGGSAALAGGEKPETSGTK